MNKHLRRKARTLFVRKGKTAFEVAKALGVTPAEANRLKASLKNCIRCDYPLYEPTGSCNFCREEEALKRKAAA